MPVPRHLLSQLPLVCGLLLATGCRYAGPYEETHEDLTLTYSADPSTAVYVAGRELGSYRLLRFEGRARGEWTGGAEWALEALPVGSSQAVAQPFSAPQLTLEELPDDRVRLRAGEHTCTLRFVTGSWQAYATGQDVVLRFEEAAWNSWLRASQNALLQILERARGRVVDAIDRSQQQVSAARIVEVEVTERPLVRANRGELMVFLEALRLEGGFAVSTRRPSSRRGWWDYELHPEVGEALAVAARSALVMAVWSLEVCGHLAHHCR